VRRPANGRVSALGGAAAEAPFPRKVFIVKRCQALIAPAALALGMIVSASGPLVAQGSPPESLVEIRARWERFLAEAKDLPREERVARGYAFFRSVPWERICAFCTEEYAQAGPDLSAMISGMVTGKLKAEGGDTRLLASVIADPKALPDCQKAIIKFLSMNQDSILGRPEDAAIYSAAILALADAKTQPQGIAFELERAAAALHASDALLERTMARVRSEDPRVAKHGMNMVASSIDPRAADSLVAFLAQRFRSGLPCPALGRGLVTLAATKGAAQFDFMREVYSATDPAADPQLHRDALQAMATTQDARFYPILLAEYKDEATGIVQDTHAIVDPDGKSFYWTRWHMTRLAEPGIIRELNADSPAAFTAVELLDRASWFGLPASREELLKPLEAWAGRRGGPWPQRISLIINRFRSYPDPTQR
jgi:hypothetical protein